MNNFEPFIASIVNDYFDSRLPISQHERVSRGTSRVVSSLAEERVAELLLSTYSEIGHIYLDQGMSNAAVPLRKPDLAVVVDGQVRLLIDVKMDLNWKRDDLPAMVDAAESWLNDVLACGAPLNVNARRSENRRENIILPFSPDCQCIILIISGSALDPHPSPADAASQIRRVTTVALWPSSKHPNHATKSREEVIDMLQKSVQQDAVRTLQKICDHAFL